MADPLTTSIGGRTADKRLPRPTQVKNKTPANVQITAEQIVREAKEREEDAYQPPANRITDADELAEYRLKKRKEFEDTIRRVRWNAGAWVKYAKWEEGQGDLARARSVWERALDVDYHNVSVWLKYVEMEMKHRQVNHARNLWDRAVSLLPRIDQLWYKYVNMEEHLGNVPGCRQIFERWMQWEPDHQGWMAYIRMELRYNENERARQIFEKYLQCHPVVKTWVRYAKFEAKSGNKARARAVYERAIEELGEDGHTEELFIKFCEFEEHCKELERARFIYKFALDHIPKGQANDLYRRFVQFEKQHGDRDGIEEVIVSKRRFQYEEELKKNSHNYDAWFDYARLEETHGEADKVREVYERAIANIPPATEKRYWQRYIYLWINYALFEELEAEDPERTREVYRECLKLVPHKQFSFSKVWLMAAQFEIRQKRLPAARQILGMAIGMAPKAKIFKTYIEIELQLGNIERCRTLYEKFLEWNPPNCQAWVKFAELEQSLAEADRARSIFELAIAQPMLDMPEVLWKAYIDFEISQGERENTRQLYERLLDRTTHVKVWMSYAQFEEEPMPEPEEEEDEDAPAQNPDKQADEAPEVRLVSARGVFERAYRSLKETQPDAKEERVMLLEAWRAFEMRVGSSPEAMEAVSKKMPRRVKRKRAVTTEDGTPAGMEEYYDYIFPEEDANAPNLKILEAAYKWKRQKLLQKEQATETEEHDIEEHEEELGGHSDDN
mmetsp:Transcript_35189/g.67252  ORF Transcript_35189/g.67252 Transcript_35189/m.67252 type:complete len:729 (-) Transcript_35189:192-2378(-)